MKPAAASPSSGVGPEVINAAMLAMSTPKRDSAASAHTRYTRRAVRETIQVFVIDKYSTAAQVSTSLRAARVVELGDGFPRRLGRRGLVILRVDHHVAPQSHAFTLGAEVGVVA